MSVRHRKREKRHRVRRREMSVCEAQKESVPQRGKSNA